MSAAPKIIHIAAAVIRDSTDRLLLVRKRGTRAFMQAGGKIEFGETPVAALMRELREELGLQLGAADARHIGFFEAPAANEPDHVVHAELFDVATSGPFLPAAEIEELLWFDAGDHHDAPLAPLTRNHVIARRKVAE